jgi:ankyrin repeat protein
VESRGESGIQPIHLAASRGDQTLCELLMSRGADAHAAMDDGTTPAQLAAKRGFAELAEKLETHVDPPEE